MDDNVPRANAEFAPFWEALEQGRLSFPWCDACRRHHWYPLKRCPFCLAPVSRWRAVEGPGTLYTWTWVHHAFEPELREWVPYAVALVEFPDAPGIRLVTNLVGAEGQVLEVGMRVEPVFPGEPGAPPGKRVVFRV